MKNLPLLGLLTAFLFSCQPKEFFPSRILWYNTPAEYFEQAIPLGNGRIGATVFGNPHSERILLNEATLWAGQPVDANMNPDAYKNLPAVRKALFEENYPLADSLVRNLQGKFSESYAPLGDIFMDFDHSDTIQNYYRELDLSRGISKVTYNVGNTHFSREYFVSNPDQLLLIKLNAYGKESLNFEIKNKSLLRYSVDYQDNIIIFKGLAPIYAEPNYRKNIENPIGYDEEKGMRFEVISEIKSDDGNIEKNDSSLQISNAKSAEIRVSIATSFNGFDKIPGTQGKDESALAGQYLTKVKSKKFEEIKKDHIADFQSLFNRVVLDLGDSNKNQIPTNERLKQYSDGAKDNDLEALYFQFGRYLMISGSRPGGQPMNLQGIWNPHLRPPWSSNYTTNINAEMNYWPAEVCNLSECHEPLFDFIEDLSVTGAITAKTFYDCGGWCCSHNSDIWAMTNPVGDFGKGHPVWANWSMAGPWYCTHLWEHYDFTRDLDFLKEKAYPLMKGAAQFCLDYLVEDSNGYLVTAPSTSPENIYITDKGYKGATLYGGTGDLAMIREHFQNTMEAAQMLNIDLDFQKEMEFALIKMYPYQIGNKGNLQEWYHDWEDAYPEHRHVTHLFGLHPGTHISPKQTPDLAAACKKSLELRGDGGTGWSKGWKINLWARLLDGNHAHKMIRTHLTYSDPNPKTEYRGGGTYPNLWDAHPPFQIDGNFGGTAGIAEMLIQSHEGEIHLLPALPDSWADGHIIGLMARGGFKIDIYWEKGKLKYAIIHCLKGGKGLIRYENKTKEIDASVGEIIDFVPN